MRRCDGGDNLPPVFTGLVTAVGEIAASDPLPGGGRRLEVAGPGPFFAETTVGDSVAVAGVCLTVVWKGSGKGDGKGVRAGNPVAGESVAFEVAEETLARSTLGALGVGAPVNLELPLRASDRLGGHFVQGHVDATGEVRAAGGPDGDYRVLVRHAEPDWIVSKGSVALDGVSLTVAGSFPDRREFEVMLIPHTRRATTLGALAPGDRVNLEYDILAKYARPRDLPRDFPGDSADGSGVRTTGA